MSYKVDYHIHSWYSDGTMKPTALVQRYHKNEYDMIAITDHDGIDGVKEAMIAGEALKIKVLSGVELAADYQGVEIHILGYQFDIENQALQEKLKELKMFRKERNEKMLQALDQMGVVLTEEDLKQRPEQTYIGKPNFARAMVAKGYISSPKEAFIPGKYLEAPQIKAIEKKKLSAEEAICLIREAGGIAVLAHPAKIKKLGERGTQIFWDRFEDLLRDLKALGLRGIECYYPEHSEEETLHFVDLAAKYHLHITEGSDFHGEDLV